MAFLTNRSFMLLTFLFFLESFSFCQSTASRNIETTFYALPPSSTTASFPPSDAPAPEPLSPPPWPDLPSKETVETAVCVASASTIFGAAFLFFLCNKYAGHKKKERNDAGATTVVAASGTVVEGSQAIVEAEFAGVTVDQNAIPLPPPPPPPPPMPAKKGPTPPPLPPKGGGALASSRPPPAPKRSPNGRVARDASEDQVKLKPLHWEKVNIVNRGHSMVWDKIEHGSFQYNDDMIEALFGSVPSAVNKTASNSDAKIFILDPRRSQNIAIVIRSLGGISTQELIDGILEGKGLNVEILEKLTRMTPTEEEKIKILAFDDQTGELADAESFLYPLLKAVPSAFTRVNAMLFRHSYDSDIQQLKNALQTLDFACTELRSRGVFLKLLEATLKAGNRLNKGTARGDAKAFNLTALHKLSDYKNSDGKTTLLHFVVHEVVRNEGRRCVMNRNISLGKSNSQKIASSNTTSTESTSKEDEVISNEGRECKAQENPSSTTASVEFNPKEGEVITNEEIQYYSQEKPNSNTTVESKPDKDEVIRNEERQCNSIENLSSTTMVELKAEEDDVIRNEEIQCNSLENLSEDDAVIMNGGNQCDSQQNSSSKINSVELESKEDQEKEFLKLGLPIIEGLSSEFTNVQKAAMFDYDTLSNISTSLGAHIAETSELVLQCAAESGQGEFITEMKEFLGGAKEEIKSVQEEKTRVMESVKKTSEYYQSGAFKDNQSLQLFAIVKDFLAMVDKACVDIARSLQQRKASSAGVGSSAASSARTSFSTANVLSSHMTFRGLPAHFLSEKSNANNSDDDC
ncbi:hypothetical protein vseg_002110 [Gypsophila vaccaria]